jgi:hypothetical protein
MQGVGIDPADGDGFAVLLAQPSAVNIRRARRKDQQHAPLRFPMVPLPVERAATLRLRVAQEDQAGTLSWGSVALSLIGQSQCLCRVTETSAGTNGVTLGWGWWLTSHAAIHGCLVGAITQSPLLGVAELIAHLLIDFGRCRRLWSLAFDQMVHIITKILWAWLAIGQASPGFWLS